MTPEPMKPSRCITSVNVVTKVVPKGSGGGSVGRFNYYCDLLGGEEAIHLRDKQEEDFYPVNG